VPGRAAKPLAVGAGRGVALVQQGFNCLSGPRLKVRPFSPAPPPAIVGIAYRKDNNSAAIDNFIAAAKRTKAG
jgi:DNA-binding transcriptional LysR family regulator